MAEAAERCSECRKLIDLLVGFVVVAESAPSSDFGRFEVSTATYCSRACIVAAFAVGASEFEAGQRPG